ncbi:MAG TPA: tetratricopeptide repeat-containing sensor histidine kinase [Mucilaginibacter sp.]|nr:tetratricopeptide repeat-containing sensor histidine kinase [Mucilaginibacter sp.]
MKKFLLLIALITAGYSPALSQKSKVDSFRKAYQKNKQDSTLALLLVERSSSDFLTTDVDSGMICARQALNISRKIGFKKGEVRAKAAMAVFLNISGDLPGSLKITFETLPEAIQIKETRVVASCYNTRGLTYSTLKDRKKSLDNYYAFLHIAEKYHLTSLYTTALNNIARQYLDMDRLDSATWFNQKAYDVSIKKNLMKYIGYPIRNFGIIRFKKGDMAGAIAWYKKSLSDSSTHGNHYLQSEDSRRIAEAYQKLGKSDSVIDYAKKAFEEAKLDRNPDQVQRATTLLTDQYKLKGDFKNAFYYQQVTQTAKDSLFSQQKTLQVQNLAYNEEQRKQDEHAAEIAYQNRVRFYVLLGVIGVFVLIAAILLFANSQRKKANTILKQQNDKIETQRKDLEKIIADLKNTQIQLIQSEKMASLGELTAGIAHEIQNPLNFVNNFSEINTELIDEMQNEIDKGSFAEVKTIADDIKENQLKISQHGKRADFIVKGMLQHSRVSTGERQVTNLNVLADEFFKLSYHGLRAKDKSFNAEMITSFAPDLPKVNIVQQDIGRVLLNLFNNAFYAVNQKAKNAGAGYRPEVLVSTSTENGQVIVKVKDNGNGIPDAIKDKIMQPFFTTKPTGEGTGLGLSLSYDIVVKGHGGSININSKEGEGSEFIILLPA